MRLTPTVPTQRHAERWRSNPTTWRAILYRALLRRRAFRPCLAISYAARRVSILQTWTYRPQKRQDGSAFALTYILRLRSCKSMDAFVISSLPSLCWRLCKWQGPLAPRTLRRFVATTDPAATLSSSADFPVWPVIRPTLLRRFLAGTRRASPVARHVLVTVLSLPPRQGEQPYQSDFGCSCCLRPTVAGSALGDTHFRGHNAFTFVTAR